MIRKLTLVAALTAGVALPALAQQPAQIDRGKSGPTESMSTQVPPMKGDETTKNPSMTPAQTAPGAATGTTTGAATGAATTAGTTAGTSMGVVLSEVDAKNWIGKPVYSSDGQKIGEVESFRRGTDSNVVGLNAGIGGFLGLGETHVMLSSSQFKLAGDRVTTSILAADAKSLPKVTQ